MTMDRLSKKSDVFYLVTFQPRYEGCQVEAFRNLQTNPSVWLLFLGYPQRAGEAAAPEHDALHRKPLLLHHRGAALRALFQVRGRQAGRHGPRQGMHGFTSQNSY